MSEIIGVVDSNLRPTIRLRIVRSRVTFPVWIDLGFEGDLVLTSSEAHRLGAQTTGRFVDVALGDGSQTQMPLATLAVRMFNRTVNANILVSDDVEPARTASGELLGLIGLGLLANSSVLIDLVPQGRIVITKPIPRTR